MMKKKYGDTIGLLFTDTDSLMYELCTDDFYQDMWAMKEEFDITSDPMISRWASSRMRRADNPSPSLWG